MRRAVFRVVDTGLSRPAANLQMDRRWLVGHAHGERDNLLRFYRSTPSAWLGLHQWPERELRLQYCHRKSIEVVRRPTGGGALYVDERQLAFSLIVKWSERLAAERLDGVMTRAAEAVAAALRTLGIGARFEAPNDITVHGRKLATVFASRYRNSVLVQGVVLYTCDAARLLNALRLPGEPMADADGPHPAHERLAALDEVCARAPAPAQLRKALAASLASAFNLQALASTKTIYAELREPPRAAAPPAFEQPVQVPTEARHWRAHEAALAASAEAFRSTPGGLLRARLQCDALQRTPLRVEIGGAAQVYPPDLFARLAAALEGCPAEQWETRVRDCCAEQAAQFTGCTAGDVLAVLAQTWARAAQQRRFGLDVRQANRLTVVEAPGRAANAEQLVQQADTVLLPYCARLPECRGKPLDDCNDCSGCEVGAACRAAQRHGLQVRAMNGYGALAEQLAALAAAGSTGVVAMTCQTFFIKHGELFTRAGLPLLLMDIDGNTCYELHQESAGYRGEFPGKTQLDVPVFERLLAGREDTVPATVQQAVRREIA